MSPRSEYGEANDCAVPRIQVSESLLFFICREATVVLLQLADDAMLPQKLARLLECGQLRRNPESGLYALVTAFPQVGSLQVRQVGDT
ncbi:hypothetical protein AF72_10665 [Xylella taiwanensis]|uniref:Uncharacterized protein n=1 Tax=Xylella taiwanensis TaxID=1444770 RepID=Z9JHA3_9GAMM|nr:hypothetical protein AB672_05585 [Xylella taiwanensis]EWS77519.1 hypothetical protein AF72_10665 [Xylella taiwanensis]